MALRRGFIASKIAVFNIGEHDILSRERSNSEDLEKFSLENENLVKLALAKEKNILFRLKTRKPSKRGFFIRTVVNYLDAQQRAEKEISTEHENKKCIAFFLEEAQNAFSSRSTSSTENETFLSVFNEARNQKIAFFTASQRLNDFSKTIRAKQLQCIGKLSNEDISPYLRKIEKAQSLSFSEMKERTWFFDGKTFLSPTFKQQGKPHIINAEIKQIWLNTLPKPKVLSFTEKLKLWLAPQTVKFSPKPRQEGLTESNSFFESEEESEEEKAFNEEEENDLDVDLLSEDSALNKDV